MKLKLNLENDLSLLATVLSGGAAATYTISGTVYDADGTTPVQSATVALGAYNATTAANGTYTISGLAAGTSGSLTCTKSGYIWPSITVNAMAADLTSQNFVNKWYAFNGLAGSGVIAYQPIGAVSLAVSYSNLFNPGTYNATPGTAPAWNATDGWVADGSKLLVADSLTLAASYDYSLFVRFSGAVSNLVCGTTTGTGPFYLWPNSGGSGHYYANGNFRNVAGDKVSGVMGFAGKNCYFDGASDGAIAGTDVMGLFTFGILAGNAGGTNKYTGNLQALVLYTGTLTSGQVTTLTNAMAALP